MDQIPSLLLALLIFPHLVSSHRPPLEGRLGHGKRQLHSFVSEKGTWWGAYPLYLPSACTASLWLENLQGPLRGSLMALVDHALDSHKRALTLKLHVGVQGRKRYVESKDCSRITVPKLLLLYLLCLFKATSTDAASPATLMDELRQICKH